MIELIYNEEEKHTTEETCLRIPKNIKKIENPPEHKKIFIDDSVNTFLHQYSMEQKFCISMAILLGNVEKKAGIRHLYIKGALPIEPLAENQGIYYFSESLWTDIYRQCEQFFPELEICGWFLARPGLRLEKTKVTEETHRTFFSGADKLLFMIEPLSGDCGFFGFDGNHFLKQQGYYIYESKNEWMSRFLAQQKSSGGTVQNADEKTGSPGRFRTLMQEQHKGYRQRKRAVYHDRRKTVVAALILLLIFTIRSQADQIQKFKIGIQKHRVEKEISKEVSADGVIVEELESGLVPLSEEPIKENAEKIDVSETPVISPSVTPKEPEAEAPKEKLTEAPKPEPEASLEPKPAYEEYRIQKGDSLAKIVRERYGNLARLEEVCELNGITDQDHVQIGETILLP